MITFAKFLTEQFTAGGKITETHNGTRRLPLSQKLRSVISNGLAGTGLNWHSFSGGQRPEGPRVGGPRHDYGNASDGEFKDVNGKSLNADNPVDRSKIAQALVKLRKAGLQGVGWDSASTGKGHYMGPQRFHLDVWGPGIWGHTKTSSSAAPWIVKSLGGVPVGGTMIQGDVGEDGDSSQQGGDTSDTPPVNDFESIGAAAQALIGGASSILTGGMGIK